LIIFASLLRVSKHFVGFVDLFEALLSVWVTRIYVGMTLPSQAAEGALDLRFIGVAIDAQDLVVVFVFHINIMMCGRLFEYLGAK
jgi:hypothetical protein